MPLSGRVPGLRPGEGPAPGSAQLRAWLGGSQVVPVAGLFGVLGVVFGFCFKGLVVDLQVVFWEGFGVVSAPGPLEGSRK